MLHNSTRNVKLHLNEREQISVDAKQVSLPFNNVWCLFSDGLDGVNDYENKRTDIRRFIRSMKGG